MPSQFTIYSSSMADAPILDSSTGSLVNLLNKVLVTGFGATPGAGWILAYTSSNGSGSCYKAPGGTGFYLSVQDDTLVTSYPHEARCRAFEKATSWNSGSGAFPAPGFQGLNDLGYLQVRKQYTSTTPFAPRQWVVFVDNATMYLFWQCGTPPAGSWDQAIVFGDIYSYKGGTDLYRCIHLARENEGVQNPTLLTQCSLFNNSLVGQYMARSWGGGGQSIEIGKSGNFNLQATATYLDGLVQYPNGPDNSIVLSPIFITEPAGRSFRGHMRGIYQVCHWYTNFAYGDVIQGSGSFTGKSFITVGPWYGNGTYYVTFALETSNTIDTN